MLKILRLLTILAVIAQVGPALAAGDLATLEQRWAELNYATGDRRARLPEAEALERDAAALVAQERSPQALILQTKSLTLTADLLRSTKSLEKVRIARDLLLEVLMIAPDQADAMAALGAIYYEVPGWPIGFGNRGKAEEYLRKAIAIDPDGRDPNFFMGDFLILTNKGAQAIPFLEKALAATQQDTVADKGRRAEIEEAFEKARRKPRR